MYQNVIPLTIFKNIVKNAVFPGKSEVIHSEFYSSYWDGRLVMPHHTQ